MTNYSYKLLVSGWKLRGETVSDAADVPHLIIGDVGEKLSMVAYVDGEPLFESSSEVEAFLLLLAAYWVFNITLPSDNRA